PSAMFCAALYNAVLYNILSSPQHDSARLSKMSCAALCNVLRGPLQCSPLQYTEQSST
ncbi:hypothetical protein PoB_006680400, partial [Plakobranchus ocellatus]